MFFKWKSIKYDDFVLFNILLKKFYNIVNKCKNWMNYSEIYFI